MTSSLLFLLRMRLNQPEAFEVNIECTDGSGYVGGVVQVHNDCIELPSKRFVMLRHIISLQVIEG